MKTYGVIFLLLATGWAAVALHHGGAALWLLWPAVSFFVVAVAYLGAGPGPFGKRKNGTIAPWALIALLPYTCLAWLTWWIARASRWEAACSLVAPNLWIGRRPAARDLPPAAVILMVDLTCELWEPRRARRLPGYLCVPTLDYGLPPLQTLSSLVGRIAAADGVVLIHCAEGHGRSAAVAAAVLVARGLAPDLPAAERQLALARPRVRINADQRRGLVAWYENIRRPLKTRTNRATAESRLPRRTEA